MSAYKSLLRVRAFESGEVQPYRRKRHFHVSERPFVLAFVQMAGEPFSMSGALCGRDRDQPYWILAPDPRNRDLQSAALEQFAEAFLEEVNSTWAYEDEPLQLWVSNEGAALNLRRIGRVMRAREVSENVSRAGAYLDLYAQAAMAPGSSLCVPATQALAAHGVTGQSPFEDSNLASQLVWWDRSILAEIGSGISKQRARSMSACEAAAVAERTAMGTLPNPRFDEKTMEPLISRFNEEKRAEKNTKRTEREIATALEEQIWPIWNAIWFARDQLAKLREAPSADDRWAKDANLFGWQYDWLNGGGHIRYTDTPMRAARMLSSWESDLGGLARSIVLEDDLALVEAVMDGAATVGVVDDVAVRKIGRKSHPFITLTAESTAFNVGTKVWWRDKPKVAGVIRELDDTAPDVSMEIEVVGGMTHNAMPHPGDRAAFISIEPPFPIRPKMPRDAPWTHAKLNNDVEDDDDE